MSQELLNGCDPAARIEKLGGAGMPEPVRIDLDPNTFPGSLDAAADEASAQRRVAVQEDMLTRSGPADGQVLPQRLDGGIGDIDGAVFWPLPSRTLRLRPSRSRSSKRSSSTSPERKPHCQSK